MTPITATFPTVNFPKRGELERDAFVSAQENAQDVLSDTWNTAATDFKNQTNTLATELNNLVEGQTATQIHGATAKTTPADNDELGLVDSASSWVLKKLTWGNLKTFFVGKVTSTDNAIVRFNGTNGEVQNSGVFIDDSGNVGIGTSSLEKTLSVNGAGGISIMNVSSTGRRWNIKNDGDFIIGNYVSDTNTVTNNLTIDSAGNVGIGVTPSAWATTVPALQIGSAGAFISSQGGIEVIRIGSNNYYNSGFKYVINGNASRYDQSNGTHTWLTAPSGTAGNNINWTTAMTLDANSNLTVGGNSINCNKVIADGESIQVGATSSLRYSKMQVYKHSGISAPCGAWYTRSVDGGENYIWTDDSDQLRISSTITHIGTTSGTVIGTQTSDERVKNIVGTCPYGLSEILELETYKYSMKDDVENTYKLGFVAQQAMGVIPESVYDTNERLKEPVTVIKTKVVQEAKEAELDDEGNVLVPAIEEIIEEYEDIEYQDTDDEVTKLAMDYQMMIPVLVNAIKELKAEIELLKGDR